MNTEIERLEAELKEARKRDVYMKTFDIVITSPPLFNYVVNCGNNIISAVFSGRVPLSQCPYLVYIDINEVCELRNGTTLKEFVTLNKNNIKSIRVDAGLHTEVIDITRDYMVEIGEVTP